MQAISAVSINSTASPCFQKSFIDNLHLVASQHHFIVLTGQREHDRFQLNNSSNPISLHRLCHEQLDACATYLYEPCHSRITLDTLNSGYSISSNLPSQMGEYVEQPLVNILQSLEQTTAQNQDSQTNGNIHLVIDGTYLLESPNSPMSEEFQLVSMLEHCARQPHNHIRIIVRCAASNCLPTKLLSLPYVTELYLPPTSVDERETYIAKHPQHQELANRCDQSPIAIVQLIAKQTDGMTLTQLTSSLHTCISCDITSTQILQEVIMAIRLGIANNPWASPSMFQQIRSLPDYLKTQIIGQNPAISAVQQPLIDAVIGLTDSHKPNSQAPRAKLLFAGSTGTGKTETCKAIARHLYGSEKILRFDCGEFAQEHTVARLIGSPPGYIGHESSGELIEGVKKNPASVILFDEIEKAHEKIWNIFLGILDDGCVTSGQGETVFLNNCILIFTTNLGSTEFSTDTRTGQQCRKRTFDYTMSYQQIREISIQAVSDYFTSELGKPELEGRFGGKENFVVFDMLREWNTILDKYIIALQERSKRLYNIELEVSDALKQKVLAELDNDENAQLLGGRGLAKHYKQYIESVLSNYLFNTQVIKPSVLKLDLDTHQQAIVKTQ